MGLKSDTLMNPGLYAFVNGQHFVTFQANGFAAGAFAYGATPAAIASSFTPLNIVTGQASSAMGLVPSPANDAFTLFVASVDPGLANASIWAGSVTPAGFPSLAKTPPPVLTEIFSTTAVTSVGGVDDATSDASYIYGAGASFGQTDVLFTWTRRDGTPLVVEQQISTTANATCSANQTCNTIQAAAAASIGSTVLVAWTEQTATTPPTYLVNGLRLICGGG